MCKSVNWIQRNLAKNKKINPKPQEVIIWFKQNVNACIISHIHKKNMKVSFSIDFYHGMI